MPPGGEDQNSRLRTDIVSVQASYGARKHVRWGQEYSRNKNNCLLYEISLERAALEFDHRFTRGGLACSASSRQSFPGCDRGSERVSTRSFYYSPDQHPRMTIRCPSPAKTKRRPSDNLRSFSCLELSSTAVPPVWLRARST